MAIKNPRKVFNFRIQFPQDQDLPIFSVQSVTLPDKENEADEHGHGNTVIKTAGLSRLSNATLTRIMSSTGDQAELTRISKFFFNWAQLANNPIMGTGMDEALYKKTILVHEVANDGVSIIGTVVLYGCWPTKVSGREYKRAESGNIIETVELAVDYMMSIK